MMYDCYHMQLMEGNLENRINEMLPMIGHIQIASVPKRAEPNIGEVNYQYLLPTIVSMGYDGYFGAEYAPVTTVEEGLGWLSDYQRLS